MVCGEKMYTDDKAAQIVLALLKAYNISKIVVSPGTASAPIAGSVQNDPFFDVYSVVDERSAAYFASGLAHESGEPVVISCTGATASRNYLSALTEAYYRNLPVIALTSQREASNYGNLTPQVTNRTISQNDVKRISVHLPLVKDDKDREKCILAVNEALIMATTRGKGPVHINLLVSNFFFSTKTLPDIQKMEYRTAEDMLDGNYVKSLVNLLQGKRIGVFIGSHRKFSIQENIALETFVNAYDTVVFYDHTSNYKGKNKVLTSVASDLIKISKKPEIVIDIGGINGDNSPEYLFGSSEFWRISEDEGFHCRYGKTKIRHFAMSEILFFSMMANTDSGVNSHLYYTSVMNEISDVIIPDMPLSNIFISYHLATHLPNSCSLHLGILNSLRSMSFWRLDESIDCSCNVGGFGIDGPVSTLIGQSMSNSERLYFGLVGDLAFFYDMNALGIRHVKKNIRLLVVNNGQGAEFRLHPILENQLGNDIDPFIAASGHYGSAKSWAESMGFVYLTAKTKSEYLDMIKDFCSSDVNHFEKPVLFEVFTNVKDEQIAFTLLRNENKSFSTRKREMLIKMTKILGIYETLKKIKNRL
jgi:2-succinyl-5-enolpyruvyl-6-hydroxy-3-cyclohexene-1-carboxylate synthase